MAKAVALIDKMDEGRGDSNGIRGIMNKMAVE